jgi:hypothetical protein
MFIRDRKKGRGEEGRKGRRDAEGGSFVSVHRTPMLGHQPT